jgi:hypothetical protein
VTIKLKRKPTGDKDAKLAEVSTWNLNFGGSARFTLSAGVAYSQLENQTFERVQGVDSSGAVINKVGYKRNSEGRTTPLVMLHTRFWSPETVPVDLHASFGLSAKIEDGETNAEYLTGLSFSLAEDRFFLTLGAYYGGVQRLEGGLAVGDKVPDDIATLPTRTEWHWKPGIALTLRIR